MHVRTYVPSILEMCFLTFPAQPWQWMATFITTTYKHTHTHTHESHASMLYHRATHAMHMAVESCDTATKRPACMHVATTTLFVLTR
jgi:hypothetical protein